MYSWCHVGQFVLTASVLSDRGGVSMNSWCHVLSRLHLYCLAEEVCSMNSWCHVGQFVSPASVLSDRGGV